jgi:hypothetical protein
MRLCTTVLAIAFLFSVTSQVLSGGMAYDDNITVLAPDSALAAEVLSIASRHRKELAQAWLGHELPNRMGRAGIQLLELLQGSEVDDYARTWLKSSPDQLLHRIWISSRREQLSCLLAHELTHVIIETAYPGEVPSWAHEGAASLQDDSERRLIRQHIIGRLAKSCQWPQLRTLLIAPTIRPNDPDSYAVAACLTDYLLDRGDKTTFLRFAIDGARIGYDRALRKHYSIDSLASLQTSWEAWATKVPSPPPPAVAGGHTQTALE